MPGLCQLSGCCMAPLLFRCEGGGQGDDDQLSHGDQLESGHMEKSQGSRLVEEVSVLVRDNEKYYHPPRLTQNEYIIKVMLLTFTQQVAWSSLVLLRELFL